ncbi:MAG: hypothetical protein ABI831_04705 [Betaproteobacteria bacterium]
MSDSGTPGTAVHATLVATDRAALGGTAVAVSRLGIGGGSSFVRAGDESGALIDTM